MILELLKESPAKAVPAMVVMDVGAMLEGAARYAPLVAQGCATVVGFEPQAAELAKLRASAPPTHKYLPYFLGKGGPATFHSTRYPGCSSIYEPDPDMINLFSTIGAGPDGNFHVVSKSQVQTHRLDDIRDFPHPDLVKLDVQGAELDVLEGGADSISRALVLELEVEFVPLYRRQPLFGEVHSFLAQRGFVLHKLIDVAGRTFAPMTLSPNPYLPLSQMLWADAIFVRDFSRLARFADEDLLKIAVILDEVYGSHDLVAYFLGEIDRRGRTELRARYYAAIGQTPVLPSLLNMREAP